MAAAAKAERVAVSPACRLWSIAARTGHGAASGMQVDPPDPKLRRVSGAALTISVIGGQRSASNQSKPS